MAQNQVATNKPKFSVAIQSEGYQKLINQTLGDPKVAQQFVADISTVVSTNPTLSKCDSGSILSAGLVAQSLKLSLSPSLGFAYLTPFGDKAVFVPGYKGIIQLAIRSGEYEKINVVAVKEGELKNYNPFDEEYEFEVINDPIARNKAKTIGFYAMFKLKTSGFKKSIYWTREDMESHGKKYSKSYGGLWTTNFETMAFKTMLKQLIQKWGIMSIELREVFEKDMAVIKEDGTVDYVDNPLNDTGDNKEVIEQDDDSETVEAEIVDTQTGEIKNDKDPNGFSKFL